MHYVKVPPPGAVAEGVVYALIGDDGEPRYVGCTRSRPEWRLMYHRQRARYGDPMALYQWFREAGEVKLEILEWTEGTAAELRDLERWWIDRTPGLLNLA